MIMKGFLTATEIGARISNFRNLRCFKSGMIDEIWTIGNSVMVRTSNERMLFTLKDVYYKDDYDCGFDFKKGYTALVVKYTAEVLEAVRPVPALFLNLRWFDENEFDCEVLTDSLKDEVGSMQEYYTHLNRSQSMDFVCGYLIPKRMIKRGKKITLFSTMNEGERFVQFVIPLVSAENMTGKSLR